MCQVLSFKDKELDYLFYFYFTFFIDPFEFFHKYTRFANIGIITNFIFPVFIFIYINRF